MRLLVIFFRGSDFEFRASFDQRRCIRAFWVGGVRSAQPLGVTADIQMGVYRHQQLSYT